MIKYIEPREWIQDQCSEFCSDIKCNCFQRSEPIECRCCACVPLLCPSQVDRLKVEEVSAADYIHEKKKVKARAKKDTPTKAALRSFAGFSIGILITTIYAWIVLFVKSYNLWFCLTTTVIIGFFLSIFMAFSLKVRITVLLMLPQILSGQAKTIFLLLAFALVIQGPVINIKENVQRSTQSMACGAQLALNATKELTSKIKKPLMSALNILKNIGKKLRSTSKQTVSFFHRMFDAIKHAGKVLRGVWTFLANIGDVCNDELERPYIRCNKLFDEAKNNCFKVMSFLGFLCYILDAFRPLCGLARIIVIICVIPNYLQYFVRKHIKNPVLSLIRNFKDQFDFNITVVHDFDVKMNSSRNYYEVAAAIVKEIKENMETYMEMLSMFSYVMVFICVFTYIQALHYRRKYLMDINYDNIYITRAFIEIDVMRAQQNRHTLLPLSRGEGYSYLRPGSLSLTSKELKGYVFAIINVFRSFLVAMLVVVLDYLFFWVLDMVSHLMSARVTTRAPMVLSLLVNGSGYTEEIYTAVASAFDAVQNTNVTIKTRKCQVQPSEPDYIQYLLIGFLHGLAFFIATFGVYMQRLKRYICAHYYPTREQVRISYLYNKLLTKRMHVDQSLLQSIRMNEADKGHTNIVLILAANFPWLFGWIVNYMGASEKYCMACAQICTGKNIEEYRSCNTHGCTATYCKGCSEILKGICSICMAPLLDIDFEDEVIDSSDDEKVALWIEATKSMKKDEESKKMKKYIKGRIKQTTKRRGKNDNLIQKYKESIMSNDSEESSGLSDMDSSEESEESDHEYQKSKIGEDSHLKWRSSKTIQWETDPIPLADILDTKSSDDINSMNERDVERGRNY